MLESAGVDCPQQHSNAIPSILKYSTINGELTELVTVEKACMEGLHSISLGQPIFPSLR